MDFTSTNLKRALVITALIFVLGGLILFTYFSYLHALKISENAIVDNNKATAKQYLAFLEKLGFASWTKANQLILLQEICNEFYLPFEGYFMVTDKQGNFLVNPETKGESPKNLKAKKFINKDTNEIFNIYDLNSFNIVTAKTANTKIYHLVTFVPIASDFILLMHTDMGYAKERIKKRYYPLLTFGLLIAIATCGGLLFFTRKIILNYEYELEKSNKALSRLYRRQSKISSDREQFLHILSHDLHNPFAGIISANNLYMHGLAEADEVMEMVKNSAMQGLETIALVRQLLAIESDKLQLDIQNYRLTDLINESCAMLRQMFIEKNIKIENLVPKNIHVLVDKTSFINSVINNCLTNAIKFSFENNKITITGESQENTYLLKIKDYGIGIPKELIDKLFDIKAKTSRTGTCGEKGTGFGMPLVKMLVNSYGGDIKINSSVEKENSGTTIFLTLKTPAL